VCGFAGERAVGRAADFEAVDRMAATMRSRGPDGEGSWHADGVALAHRRLKIIDLTSAGDQPMVDNELGLTVAFNGCIYNHRELRTELERDGYEFFSTSDTEVILKAYAKWNRDCVTHFKGMFAFALCEHGSGRVLLARDRLGVKPLYLARTPGALRFASTLPALLAGGGIDTELDPVALHHYLSWHSVVPPPRTIIRGVQKLPPAHTLLIEPDGSTHQERYWRADFSRQERYADWSEQDWSDAVLDSLRTAVKRRMVSDVPVGVLLSGGLDSSLIVALLETSGQEKLATFSIGFDDVGNREGNEFRYSDIIAAQFDTDHHKIHVDTGRMLPALDGAVKAMSEPMVSHDAVAFYLLSQEVARSYKVVQSGQGADEVFAGYSWYPPLFRAEGNGAEAYRKAFFDRANAEMAETVADAYQLDEDPSRSFQENHFAAAGAEDPVDRGLRLDTEVMLVDDPVKRVDNMTMAWGLEARTPFLDHELVELAAACPPELKLASGGKGVLKAAAQSVLPAEVIDRPKGYFPVPALSTLEGATLDLIAELMNGAQARARGIFRPEHVDTLLGAPNEHLTTLEGSKLWQLALLELWLDKHGL
jgi:asparagine synthase (glutamine-hydrolysing)